jgi:hypothetical protein
MAALVKQPTYSLVRRQPDVATVGLAAGLGDGADLGAGTGTGLGPDVVFLLGGEGLGGGRDGGGDFPLARGEGEGTMAGAVAEATPAWVDTML